MKKSMLSPEYYQHPDVLHLSKDLIGKTLFTHFDGQLTGGMITETEAYRAPEDQASHAYQNKRTQRNEAMFLAGGIAYVYLCYGIHVLFNVVTNVKEVPHAILIRSIQPTHGIEIMQQRRTHPNLGKGPGVLTQSLGIKRQHDQLPLTGPDLWIETGQSFALSHILKTPRIGIDYAGADAALLWRFVLR